MKSVNGYDVIITQGTPRFRLNKKLIKRDDVPYDVQQQLLADAMNPDAVKVVEAAPDKATEIQEGEQLPLPLEEAMEADIPEAVEEEVSPAEKEGADFTDLELQLLEENDALKRQLAEPSAPVGVEDLGVTLLRQYGIYTALAPRDPQIGDIHPFTLKPMNRYDTGLAYAERKKSMNVSPETLVAREVIQPKENPEDNGGFPSFATRTGVSFGKQSSSIMQNHNNDPINDEATAEPNLRGTTVRRYW